MPLLLLLLLQLAIVNWMCTCAGPAGFALRFCLGLLAADVGLLGKPLLYMVLRSGLRDRCASGTALTGLEGSKSGPPCLG